MSPRPHRSLPPDPVRQQLVEVRRALFRLHKTLIDAERARFERDRGPLTSGQFLQALIGDPFFAWLRPFSALIVEMDEALAGGASVDAPSARAYVERVHALVAPGDVDDDEAEGPGTAGGRGGSRYARAMHANAEVLLAHVELEDRIAAASGG